MKAFFGKLKNWWSRHKPTKRRLIQLYAFLLYNANIKGFIKGEIYQGNSKYLCVPGLNCYSCPGAVGACPLGALQNALSASNTKAPFYVLGILLLFGLIFGRTICGFLCPMGLGQELLYKIKTPKLKKSKVTRILSYLKYVILAVFVIAIPVMYSFQLTAVPGFCKYICPSGTFLGAIGLLLNPSNESYFAMLGPLFTWKFCLLIAICVASVFIFRVFCRFICPLGALYGFFNKIAFIGIKLDINKCTDCGLCVAHCKMDIKHVGDHECIDCGECIDICPAKAIRWKGSKLFLHRNAVEAIETPAEDVKPLAVVMSSGSVEGITNGTQSVVPPQYSVEDGETAVKTEKKRGKGRAFWLQFTAWAVALCVLVGALVYYNFLAEDKEKEISEGYQIGELCADFSVSTYGNAEEFSISKLKGTATMIAFWGSDTDESIEVLEGLIAMRDKLSSERKLTIQIVSIYSAVYETNVASAIDTQGWNTEDIIFGKDINSLVENFGYEKNDCVTILLNRSGVITAKNEGAMTTVKDIYQLFEGKAVGDYCPEFTVPLYGEGGEYSVADSRGKVTIINFWATWCGPCVMELPDFEKFYRDYADNVTVVAICTADPGADIPTFIDAKGWKEYGIMFGQDAADSGLYYNLGGKGSLPMTVILDRDGFIVYNQEGSVTYEKLRSYVEPILEK